MLTAQMCAGQWSQARATAQSTCTISLEAGTACSTSQWPQPGHADQPSYKGAGVMEFDTSAGFEAQYSTKRLLAVKERENGDCAHLAVPLPLLIL